MDKYEVYNDYYIVVDKAPIHMYEPGYSKVYQLARNMGVPIFLHILLN